MRKMLLMNLALGLAVTAYAGTLTPPGAPAGTMKNLEIVEPRIPISSLPFTISQSGCYYLTASLPLATQNTDGITISTGAVTLDLNGFALIGPGKSTGSSGGAVVVAPGVLNGVRIRNGAIRNWAGDGIRISNTELVVLHGLTIENCGQSGVVAYNKTVVEDCLASSNGYRGLWLAMGCTVRHCSADENGDTGIAVQQRSIVEGCRASSNTATGINTGAMCIVSDSLVAYAGTFGIITGQNSRITGNVVANCTKSGIDVSGYCLIEGNTVSDNTEHGINLGAGCRVVGNLVQNCGGGTSTGAGIYSGATYEDSVIERNVLLSNDIGIDVNAQGNYIAANRASGNPVNFDIAAGNTQGSGDLANVSY